MRKVFLVLMVLSLGGLMVACSKDDQTVRPLPPQEPEFEITTTQIAGGYTCEPYNVTLEARGGTPPYTWELAEGSTLPAGVVLSSDGRIYGLIEIEGSWSFEVVCTDASETPVSAEVELTLGIQVTPNPSIALFYDMDASICCAETMAFMRLDCHVFLMLQGGDPDCAYAAEFKIWIEDEDGNVLDPAGDSFYYTHINYSPDVTVHIGNPFNGVALAFDRPKYGAWGDVRLVSFGLILEENLSNMVIRIGASPGTGLERPIIVNCETPRVEVEVSGRASALNYVLE